LRKAVHRGEEGTDRYDQLPPNAMISSGGLPKYFKTPKNKAGIGRRLRRETYLSGPWR